VPEAGGRSPRRRIHPELKIAAGIRDRRLGAVHGMSWKAVRASSRGVVAPQRFATSTSRW